MQLQANILGRKVVRPTVIETMSLGAAYIAGLASGFWKDISEIKRNWQIDKIFIPEWSEEKREKMYKGWKKALKRSLNWAER